MMKRYVMIVSLVLVGLLAGVPADAQKNKKDKDTKEIKDNKKAKDTKEAKDTNEAKVTKEEDPWKLLHEKETVIRDLESKCHALEEDTAEIRKKHEEAMQALRQQYVKDTADIHQKYEKELVELLKQHEDDVFKLLEKEAQLDKLKDIQEQWVQQLVTNVDNNWVSATCSLANARSKQLDQEIEACERYNAGFHDKRVEDALQKLEKVKQDVGVYLQMKELLTKAYDKQTIEELLPLAEALNDAKSKDSEVKDLYEQLSMYEGVIMTLKNDILPNVDKEFESDKKSSTFALVRDALNQGNIKSDMDDVLSYGIPWVNNWYNSFYQVINAVAEGTKKYKDYEKVRNQLMNIEL